MVKDSSCPKKLSIFRLLQTYNSSQLPNCQSPIQLNSFNKGLLYTYSTNERLSLTKHDCKYERYVKSLQCQLGCTYSAASRITRSVGHFAYSIVQWIHTCKSAVNAHVQMCWHVFRILQTPICKS